MLKMLIVDDEPDIEQLFVQKFRKKIYQKEWSLLFAQNGKQALRILKEQPDIELVLSDINMPEMDGLTLLEEIKNHQLNTKTVIISAYGDMKNIRTAMNRGAFDFVTKPIDFEDVLFTIEKTAKHIEVLRKALESQNQLTSFHKELEVAKTIQESILPLPHSPHSQYEIFTQIIPAKEVGGDFYDFFLIDKNHLCIVIADVSGKGISSAIFAVVTQTLLKSIGSKTLSPKECIESVNRTCSQNNQNCMFATAFYGVLNLKTGVFQYTNAGHNQPYKIDLKGQVKALASTHDLPLGIQASTQFTEHTELIYPNETLFLYTDGITEAKDVNKKMFTEDRLVKVLSSFSRSSIQEIGSEVLKSVQLFCGEADQSDDITYLLCQYKNH